MNTVKKIMIIFMMIMLVVTMSSCYFVNAGAGDDVKDKFPGMDMSDIDSKANDAGTKIQTTFGIVLEVVRVACVGIALVLLTVVGAKYMLASPNERADIKQSLIVYVIGAVVMFGASSIVGIVRDFTEANVQ